MWPTKQVVWEGLQLFLSRFSTEQLEKAHCPDVDAKAIPLLKMLLLQNLKSRPPSNAMNPEQRRKALLYPPFLLMLSAKSSIPSLLYCSQSKDCSLCSCLVLLLGLVQQTKLLGGKAG